MREQVKMATITNIDILQKDKILQKNETKSENMPKIEVLSRFEALAEAWVQDKFSGDFKQASKYFQALLSKIRQELNFDNLDLADIEQLDKIFDSYCDLCYSFAKVPSIEGFCILTTISRQTIYNWASGKLRQTSHQKTAQKWIEATKCALVDSLTSSEGVSPNKIYVSKAIHSLSENGQAQELPQIEVNSLDEIRAKMGIPLLSGGED